MRNRAIVDGSQQVTAETEHVQHDAMHRREPLRVLSASFRIPTIWLSLNFDFRMTAH